MSDEDSEEDWEDVPQSKDSFTKIIYFMALKPTGSPPDGTGSIGEKDSSENRSLEIVVETGSSKEKG